MPGELEKANQRMNDKRTKNIGIFLGLAAAMGLIAVTNFAGVSDTEFAAHTFDVNPVKLAEVEHVAPELDNHSTNERLVDRTPTGGVHSLTYRAEDTRVEAQAAAQLGPPRARTRTAEIDAAKAAAKVAPRDKMSGPVAALAASGTGIAEIVVRYDQHPELFDDERVKELGGEVVRSYAHLDMRAIRVPAASLEKLAGDDNIDWLSIDDEVSFTSLSSRE